MEIKNSANMFFAISLRQLYLGKTAPANLSGLKTTKTNPNTDNKGKLLVISFALCSCTYDR